jgi:AmpD protein
VKAYPAIDQLSPNRDSSRWNERFGVVFHHTEVSYAEAHRLMLDPAFQRSYHCIVREDGLRSTLVPDDEIAWHAGASVFQGRSRCNDFMLGLSFAGNTAVEPLTADQVASALEWLEPRWKRYGWSVERMTDHRQVAPGRKQDLNPTEWERLIAAIGAHFQG